MKITSVVLCTLALAACRSPKTSEQSKGRPPPLAFDGALVTQALAQAAHGERLTKVLGCRGCHGDQLEGSLWDDDPKEYGIMWASNLTRSVPAMTDGQLEALLRTGAHPSRKEIWVMPSELFQHLSAPDMTALIAYLRSLKPVGEASPPPVPGPKALSEIASGKIKPAAAMVRDLRGVLPVDLGPRHALARYMTAVTCAECHGPKLAGVKGADGTTPDLIVASAYSRAEFEKLITQGVPTGGRKLHPLMAAVAKSRFSQMTPHERDALYAYLKARADQPQ